MKKSQKEKRKPVSKIKGKKATIYTQYVQPLVNPGQST